MLEPLKPRLRGIDARTAELEAQSLVQQRLARVTRTLRVSAIRSALKLSQEDFSSRFQIPLGALRDWEVGRREPDAAARAYLLVIARNPVAVAAALRPAPGRTKRSASASRSRGRNVGSGAERDAPSSNGRLPSPSA